jgi:hypothetical protein
LSGEQRHPAKAQPNFLLHQTEPIASGRRISDPEGCKSKTSNYSLINDIPAQMPVYQEPFKAGLKSVAGIITFLAAIHQK